MGADWRDLLGLMFAEATTRIEAAHEIAVSGQSAELAAHDYVAAARRLRATALDIAALAESAAVIAGGSDHGDGPEETS